MRVWLGLLAGALIAALIACGGAMKSASAPPQATGAGAPSPAPHGLAPRDEIGTLDRQIDDELAKLGLARPAVQPGTCIDPPCDAARMATAVRPSSADPTCKPGPSDTCTETCRLSDSICNASGRICRLAGDLGGSDRYANERCASGQESCKAANARCCSCQT